MLADEKGIVGDFKTKGILEIIEEIDFLGNKIHNKSLIKLLKKCYSETTLSELVVTLNELFGKYGLVILDSNDKDFKKVDTYNEGGYGSSILISNY